MSAVLTSKLAATVDGVDSIDDLLLAEVRVEPEDLPRPEAVHRLTLVLTLTLTLTVRSNRSSR